MSKMPTPFVGGADGPQQDRAGQTEIEPPFFAEEREPGAEPDEATAGAPEPAAVEQPSVATDPEPSDYEGPVPVQQAVPDQEPRPIEQMAPAAEPEPASTAPPREPAPKEPELSQVSDEDSGLPDFLMGPDSGGAVGDARQVEPGAPPLPETPEALARQAEKLLEGDHGDQIRDLVAELGSSAAEVAIPRAFAAGYLAAKSGKEI
ncbi:MAG: hypothetical protein JSV86_20505 [Gemmatimonadota bacterium]|nr:MAG: hypothetical protein JSV86_20505 [Gemmatimonadota bacterium]